MLLKLLSYNIHKGFNTGARSLVLESIKLAIQEVGADIVFLQEVIGEHETLKNKNADWPSSTQFEYLADQIWPYHAYGRNAVYDDGHHGNAILSKFAIKSFKNFDLSSGKLEQRGLLHAELELPNAALLNCFCTHLAIVRGWRQKQHLKLCKLINGVVTKQEPLILAGDFNDWEKKACGKLEECLDVKDAAKSKHGRLLKTYPSFVPLLALDRIYIRNATVTESKVLKGRPWNKLSDHSPVYCEIEVD